MNKDRIVIVNSARTPTGAFLGAFKDTPAPQLGATVIKAAIERSHLQPNEVDEVIMGCVLPAGQGQAPARQAALAAGLPTHTSCTTINKMCGSGMKAIMFAHDLLLAGSGKIIVAGGMENMSNAPYLLPKARQGYRLGHGQFIDHMYMDGLEDAYEKGRLMGSFADDCAEQYHFTRAAQDEFASTSLQRAHKTSNAGFFKDEIIPLTIITKNGSTMVTTDELPDLAKLDKIPNLKPAFNKNGTVTAANSSSISDGAAATVLMHATDAEKKALQPQAMIIGHSTHAQEPHLFTTAPIFAIKKLLAKINWQVSDVDLFEVNEAFAVVAMAVMHDLKIPHAKLNIHGGACALGHPIGASGARIVVTLIHALKKHGLKRGIAALCIGGGEATALAIELI